LVSFHKAQKQLTSLTKHRASLSWKWYVQ